LFCRKLSNRYLSEDKLEKAAVAARVAAILHPIGNLKKMPGLIRTFRMVQLGEIEKAEVIVEKFRDLSHSVDRFAHIYFLSKSGQFKKLIEWVRQNFGEKNLFRYLDLLPYYLEALGETGQTGMMIDLYLLYTEKTSKLYLSPLLTISKLYIFSFTGRQEQVRRLLSEQLSPLAEDKKKFWLATAAQTAGQEKEAKDIFATLLNSASYSIRFRAQQRLNSPLNAAAEDFKPEIEKITRQVTFKLKKEQKYKNPFGDKAFRKKAYATYALMGIILFYFLLELIYGTDTRSLYRLGALVKVYGRQGEWWRYITSMFMHFDFNHLFLNLIGLFIIGPYVETSAGRFSFLTIYLVSGFGSMYLAIMLAPQPVLILLGASGCIMGLLGAMSYLLYLGYKREKSKIAGKSLYSVVVIFAFQVIFDIVTPNISIIAHLSGFAFGLLITGILVSLKNSEPNK
jgi:rhomboid protease GluP